MSEQQPTQVFSGSVGQVAAGDIVNLHAQPYIDPEFSRACPECGRANQLHAPACWACAYNLARHDHRQWRRRVTRRAAMLGGVGIGLALLAQHLATGQVALVLMVMGLLMAAAAVSTLKGF